MIKHGKAGGAGRKAKILEVRAAGEEHQVITTKSDRMTYRREPCPNCPWRVDSVHVFPPEAFKHSANTAYDLAVKKFGCHQSGTEKTATCAGFILRGADHNLAVRKAYFTGDLKNDVTDGGHALHENYRAMAIANGVAPDDPVLIPCRD